MIEPEMAFYDLTDNMDLAEEFLKYLIAYALENCMDDLKFLAGRLASEEKEKQKTKVNGLIEKLILFLKSKFIRLHIQAINILKSPDPTKR